jgi:predicted ATPase
VSLEAFGVKNLRCLVDTGLVPIRPITVLVGRNSSGKSTFLRAFPLLRQSVETRRSTPILWYGDEHPVDFGSLKDAASAWLGEPTVTFMFRLRLHTVAGLSVGDRLFEIEMTLAGAEAPYVGEYQIRVGGHDVRWAFDPQGRARSLSVGGKPVSLEGALSLGGKAHLLPTLQPGESSNVSFLGAPEDIRYFDYTTRADEVLLGPLVTALRPLLHGSTSNDEIDRLARDIRLGTRGEMLAQLSFLSGDNQFQQRVSALTDPQVGAATPGTIEEIVSRAIARLSPYIIEEADLTLAHVMSRVAYLAPLRVSAQRAYRVANLAVDDVDPDGKNLAMFLRSLSPAEVASFARFTQDALGFETQVKTTGLHAEILVRAGMSKRLSNLVDVGFGYSEVLPLAAVLWNGCLRPTLNKRDRALLMAIEQPELHLHPAHQVKIARMLVEAVSSSPSTRIVVETHSESLINGLGRLVHDGRIKAEDVEIVLFHQDDESEKTEVSLAGYRESGALHDWPYGFLSPVAERRAPPAAAE